MSDFTQMHIFFFVSTIGFVIIGLLVVVLLIVAIRFIQTLHSIATTVDEEAQEIREDIDAARERIKRGGNSLLELAGVAFKAAKRRRTKK